MKICYLADAASSHTRKWCKYFTTHGHEVFVISLRPASVEGVNVIHFDEDNMYGNQGIRKIRYLNYFFKIRKKVREIKPDILHSHYATSYGLIGSLIGYHPFIISVWGSDVFDFPNRNPINKMILRFILRNADYIFSTSKVMASETNRYTRKQINITPFGVDLNLFSPRQKRRVSDGEITIGSIKGLKKIYGIEYLIRAFALIHDEFPNTKLRLANDGSERSFLENLCVDLCINEDVTFLGVLPVPEVAEELHNFDIMVIPSVCSESFGVAAVEAQACGIPVVVSNVGGLVESTLPGVSSLLAESANPRSIADALKKLILSPELREKMGIEGRKYVLENFELNKVLEDAEKLYFKILESSAQH